MGERYPTVDLDALRDEVDHLRSNTVSQSSRSVYLLANCRFLLWIWINKSHLLTDEFHRHAALLNDPSDKEKISFIKEFIANAPHNPPLRFESLTAIDFMAWIVSLRKKDGSTLGYNAQNTNRSALFNLFRDYRKTMSEELSREIKNTFIGLKRKIAINQQNGNGSIKVGKSPLAFDLYRDIGMKMLQKEEKEFIFARCFLLICWNLMARSANVFSFIWITGFD
jgi:hypothetical protein